MRERESLRVEGHGRVAAAHWPVSAVADAVAWCCCLYTSRSGGVCVISGLSNVFEKDECPLGVSLTCSDKRAPLSASFAMVRARNGAALLSLSFEGVSKECIISEGESYQLRISP